MTNEVRVVKNLLQYHFPNEKINVTLRRAKQYYDTSDKIIVKIRKDLLSSVLAVLITNTRNMRVYIKGKSASISGIFAPQVFNVINNEYWDMDTVEFIEVVPY